MPGNAPVNASRYVIDYGLSQVSVTRHRAKGRENMSRVHEAQKAVLDWILLFLLQPVTFSLRLCALSLIEVQKPEEEIELQIELYPKVIWASERYTTATELPPMGTVGSLLSKAITKSTEVDVIISGCLWLFYWPCVI